MFADACEIAQKFTKPLVISFRKENGECHSLIGTYIILNDEGWCLTAAHIMAQSADLVKKKNEYLTLLKQREEISQKGASGEIAKNKMYSELNRLKIPPESVTHVSAWPAGNGLAIGRIALLTEIDLAVFELTNFKPEKTQVYPVLKNPARTIRSGTSLCKLGYPFGAAQPSFDSTTESFVLPMEAMHLPLFPIEGIYTRTAEMTIVDDKNTPLKKYTFPLLQLETSSPGLKGQSGGPTFDVHGNIWAVQTSTKHYKLGFGDGNKHTKDDEYLKNQYLHVGLGVHIETIVNFLNSLSIKHTLSAN